MIDEEKKFRLYLSSHLEPGNYLKIDATLYSNEISNDYLQMEKDQLTKLYDKFVAVENKVYENMCELAHDWASAAFQTQQIKQILEYLNAPQVTHTNNLWKENDYGTTEISNATYQMWFRIYERTTWDRTLQKHLPTAWEISWYLYTQHAPGKSGYKLAGQNRKVFYDKGSALKYIDGRKQAYAHLFQETYPPIPNGYEHAFMVSGILLPGYTVSNLLLDQMKPRKKAKGKCR